MKLVLLFLICPIANVLSFSGTVVIHHNHKKRNIEEFKSIYEEACDIFTEPRVPNTNIQVDHSTAQTSEQTVDDLYSNNNYYKCDRIMKDYFFKNYPFNMCFDESVKFNIVVLYLKTTPEKLFLPEYEFTTKNGNRFVCSRYNTYDFKNLLNAQDEIKDDDLIHKGIAVGNEYLKRNGSACQMEKYYSTNLLNLIPHRVDSFMKEENRPNNQREMLIPEYIRKYVYINLAYVQFEMKNYTAVLDTLKTYYHSYPSCRSISSNHNSGKFDVKHYVYLKLNSLIKLKELLGTEFSDTEECRKLAGENYNGFSIIDVPQGIRSLKVKDTELIKQPSKNRLTLKRV
jgi:hypothetical protein